MIIIISMYKKTLNKLFLKYKHNYNKNPTIILFC